jgi:putative ABC transport system permease protein
MNLILKIAWRNVCRHKSKSIIIGVILFLGAFIMTVGNGIAGGMNKGLRDNIVNCFTGDIVLVSDKQENDDVFLGFMGKAVEPIYNYPDIRRVLEKQGFVERYLPAGKNTAMVINEDDGAPAFAYLLGVDFGKYNAMFPNNLKPVEGRLLDDGQKGSVVTTGARKQIFSVTNSWLVARGDSLHSANLTPEAKADRASLSIKNDIVFMGMNDDNSTHDIRLPVSGIIRYKALNSIWGHFVLVDIESYRQCLGYFAANEKTVELQPAEKALLSMDDGNLDKMFSDESFMVKNPKARILSTSSAGAATIAEPPKADLESGAYNLVFVMLKKNIPLNHAVSELNKAMSENHCGVRAVPWNKATGSIGSMALIIKGALFLFVAFLFVVAIIVIVNTLSMAALERTTEIGMMRAVGAKKGFISSMFLGETTLLAAGFGGIGIAAGTIAVQVISAFHLKSENDMIQLLFGGDTLRPLLSAPDLGITVLQLALVTVLAVIYPLAVARGIMPLDAIARD